MPRPGGPNNVEKSKDFKGSIKRLITNLKPWKILMISALILAMVSAILALISPDRLSELTDVITEGIKPNTEKLEDVSKLIGANLTSDKITSKMPSIMNDFSISNSDKDEFIKIINMFGNAKEEESIRLVGSIPQSILVKLLDNITYDNTIITSDDQAKMLSLMSEMDEENVLLTLDKLPTSIYDLVKPVVNIDEVVKIAIFIGALYLISALFGFIESFLMTTVSNNFAKTLRTKISKKINTLPLKYFDTHETGDVLSRVTNDVDTIAQNLNQSLATLVTSITLFIGSVIMMFYTSGLMAITAIVSSLVGFIFMTVILSKSQKYFIAKQNELGKINGYIEEIYSGHNVVKVYNGTKEALNEFSDLNNRLYNANRKSQFLSGLMMPIMGFVGNFGYVAVCIVGALLVNNNVITFGVIVAFMIYVRLFTNPLTQIAQAMTSLQTTAAASERVFEFLDEKEMTDESDKSKVLTKKEVKGNIEFKNVKFGYDEGKSIIHDFSAKATSGEKIAIVGPTGAGKTTLVNLLMKFYEINEGDILIDGVSINDLTRENLHELFCMVLQDTWLFEGTIRDNIKFNKEDVTDEKIWETCKIVGIDHFIKTLPGGLDAVLGDNESVSSGQKQLFTIARGMLEEAPFLILDEATSNVDTRTEELVSKAMDKLTKGKTSFIIAHRLSTIKNADLILVMKDGNIIEQGNHDELMAKKGFYAELYNSQFEL
ncbi:MAG: ABC transporter ATP-binding protein/permease [Ruminococcus sp.]|nr:ABC transporter ATP-binding protein/permease [Ruminococcus sp.]